jgi:hypothetical protein
METEDVAVRLSVASDMFKKGMSEAGSIMGNFGAKAEQVFKNIGASSQAELGNATTGAQRVGSSMMALGAGAALLGAGVLAVGAKMAGTFESVGAEVLKLTRYTGLSAEEASKLRFSAEESGVSVDTLTRSLGLMAKNMEHTPAKFTDMGIAVRDSNGQLRSTSDVLLDVADKVHGTSNATEKLTIVQDAFGKSGRDMLPMMDRGREGLQALADEAQHYGLVLTADNLVAVKQAIMSHREWNAAIEGLQVQIGSKFLPILTSATETITSFVAGNHGAIGDFMLWGGATLVVGGSIAMIAGKIIAMGQSFIAATTTVRVWAAANMGAILTVGAALAAAGAVYAFYESGVKSAQSAQEKLNATVVQAVKGGSFADMTSELDKQTAAVGRWKEKAGSGGSMGDFFIWDRFAAEGKQKAVQALVDQLSHYKDLSEAVSSATGVDTDTTYKWVIGQEAAGRTFGSTGEAIAAYTGKVDTSTMSAGEAAAAIKVQQDSLKNLNDEVRSGLDPLFGMERAMESNTSAQEKATAASQGLYLAQVAYDQAVRDNGPTSDAAIAAAGALTTAHGALTTAQFGAASSAIDVTSAANTLKFAMDNGSVSIQQAKEELAGFVAKGVLTQEQADGIAGRLGFIVEKSDGIGTSLDKLNGKSAGVSVHADTGQADAAISDFARKFAGLRISGEVTFRGSSYGPSDGHWEGQNWVPSADGNLFESYAAGGIRAAESFANGSENHVAQISPAGGRTRIWAEPETGGEAYIPLSASKRSRSMQILGNVMDRFGIDSAGGDTIQIDARNSGLSAYEVAQHVLFVKNNRGR